MSNNNNNNKNNNTRKSSTPLIGFPGGVRGPTPSTTQHQVFVPGTDKKEKRESGTAYPLITQTQLQINISMSTHNGHLCRIHTPGDSLVIKANVLLSLRNDAVHSVSGFGVKFVWIKRWAWLSGVHWGFGKEEAFCRKVIISSLTLTWLPQPSVGGALPGGVTSPFEMSCRHLAEAPLPGCIF